MKPIPVAACEPTGMHHPANAVAMANAAITTRFVPMLTGCMRSP
ncbi:hypothetical protein [Nocardioides yefusunii]|uniref:Uncharacterized protein n=1 Tax=Nocardioides yefusunii TaxID=2500546 RepID=A0ABW1QW69_9ACTN|nr:hypothetical protein [Nocardioides yefusunii]